MQVCLVLLKTTSSIAKKAECFVRRKQVRNNVGAAVATARLTQNSSVCMQPAKPRLDQYVVLKCSCDHQHCCKVFLFSSLYESLWRGCRDPSARPAHRGGGAATYSVHVEALCNVVTQYCPDHIIVWDWHDIPGHPAMHFDATLVPLREPRAALHLKIDGSCHFPHGLRSRTNEDWVKDSVVNALNMSLLRSHHNDEDGWVYDLLRFLGEQEQRVVYTESFEHCLAGRPDEGNVRGSKTFQQGIWRTLAERVGSLGQWGLQP